MKDSLTSLMWLAGVFLEAIIIQRIKTAWHPCNTLQVSMRCTETHKLLPKQPIASITFHLVCSADMEASPLTGQTGFNCLTAKFVPQM